MNMKERMIRSITMRRGEIIMRSDFTRMGSQSQISRLLADFVSEGRLVRLGYGIFAKSRISSISGKAVPREPLEVLAQEAFRRLMIEAKPGKAQREYTSGQSTQVPVQAVFDTGQRRISRKLTVGNRKVRYENDYSA
ncbi:S-adenosylhomocysteine hydrolase [Chlorobium limicola]|uniref:S-adenosylhomocysteine hydrolase n=1 Tax=Chlorobium limicola TaxID=1092 RepID=A0A117MQA3_CHLLI|nr:S-adenosylhomocysteine hydrolase [Chlorobium limicola]